MPLHALPQEATRALASSQTIQHPASVIKELVDNAIDAGASAVFVEISSNSIDTIQVRDNGQGIASGDHDGLTRRHYTSKLRGLEDLPLVGGRSMGFRGEALASILEMSKTLSITTKTGQDAVGTSLQYSRAGKLLRYS